MMRATDGDPETGNGSEEQAEAPASLGRLVGDVARDVACLVRQEVGLAVAEVSKNAEDVKKGAMSAGIGAVLVHAGGLGAAAFLSILFTWILSHWMSWLAGATIATFVVAAGCLAVGWMLMSKGGETLSPGHLVPRRTIETLKEDARWARARST
jgi:hypothetical protein